MQKTLAFFLVFIGIVLLSAAGMIIWGAYVYSTPDSIYAASDKVPLISPIIDMLKPLARDPEWQETLKLREYSYLIPLGAVGAILIIVGLLAMRIAKSIFEVGRTKNIGISKSSNVVSLQSVRITGEGGEGNSGIKIDETLLEVEEDELANYADFNRLIALSHSDLDRDQCILTLKVLRPRMLNYTDLMTEEALVLISKQVLNNAVIRHKRQEKNITPDQFRRQNENMNKIEQETICRRYMPRKENLDKIPPEHKDKIGHVFIITEQSEIQQEILSDSADWRDISLSNSVAVMSEPIITLTPSP